MLGEQRCHLGEGPSYDAARNHAWWFDILERRLFEADLASGAVQVHALPFMASAMAWADGDHQVIAAEGGIFLRCIATGSLSLLLPIEADNAATRSNDGRVHPCGAFWIGTMGRAAESHAGAIYHVLGSEVTRLYSGLTIPNAICFSPDGGTGYFADTAVGVLHRVALDVGTGRPVGPPVTLYDHRGGMGCLDGAVTDAEGLIWNARWGAGCVDVYTPAGDRVRSVPVPASRPSCPAFVGPGLDQLIVTTAFEGMDTTDRLADPEHGRTFLLPVPARGVPEARARIG